MYGTVRIMDIYFGGWVWVAFLIFFLIPELGNSILFFLEYRGEGSNKNQCVKPLATNQQSTNIDKSKGSVVLLFCMNISNLSHKACLYFQEVCACVTRLLQRNREVNVGHGSTASTEPLLPNVCSCGALPYNTNIIHKLYCSKTSNCFPELYFLIRTIL